MSVALILLCVGVVAQNVKNSKNVTDYGYGVTVSMPSVVLKPKGIVYVGITIEEGYHNPFLIYGNNSNSIVNCENFTASIVTVNGNRFVLIEATSENIKEAKTETIYVKAMVKYDGYNLNKSTMQNPGVPLVVTINPNL